MAGSKPIIPGESTSYRVPKKKPEVAEFLNRNLRNKNSLITEGLEVLRILREGTAEEKARLLNLELSVIHIEPIPIKANNINKMPKLITQTLNSIER